MSKMGPHDSFGHLQQKLWQKEKLGVKIDNLTFDHKKLGIDPKSCVQVACNMPLESSWWKLQLCFRPHPDWRSEHEVIAPTKLREFQPWQFRDSQRGVLGQKAIWMRASRRGAEYTIWGKVVASFESGPWWVLLVQGRSWLVLAPKVLKHYTNQFVVS